jgi:hypothetical protein
MKDNIFGEIMYMKTTHDIWLYLNLIYGRVSNNDDDEAPKEEAHECVEHDHNLIIMKDCSTSWSSDDDERSTTSSLDKVDDDASSDVNDDATPCTLDDDDCSCLDDIATTSSPTPLHCLMSQGDTKSSSCNLIGHDSYDELVSRFASIIIALENEMAKTSKLEK